MNGGRFDFDDGGTYCGGWEEGKAHGHGVCTGPNGQGEYAGAWHYGFEVSGIYIWPSGSTYMGQWQNGKRHGLGVEQRGRWIYKGEWTQGLKGRYGRREIRDSDAHYAGTWSNGLMDGYGTEKYSDGGTYEGQWLRGMRHGYGIRTSATYTEAAKHRSRSSNMTHASLTSLRSNFGTSISVEEVEENHPNHVGTNRINNRRSKSKERRKADEEDDHHPRSGFVLKVYGLQHKRKRSLSERSLAVKRTILSGLRFKKQHSTDDIHQRMATGAISVRSSGSTLTLSEEDPLDQRLNQRKHQGDFQPIEPTEPTAIEIYRGEWKNDGRTGFGICERSDGLRYIGEWLDNKRHGYGVTFLKNGIKEEGRYKNNELVSSASRRGFLFVKSSRLRDRIDSCIEQARRAADLAKQRVEIARSRMMTAQEKSDLSIEVANRAKDDADTARICATQFDPTFKQPGIDHLRQFKQRNTTPTSILLQNHVMAAANHITYEGSASSNSPHYPEQLQGLTDPMLLQQHQQKRYYYQQPVPTLEDHKHQMFPAHHQFALSLTTETDAPNQQYSESPYPQQQLSARNEREYPTEPYLQENPLSTPANVVATSSDSAHINAEEQSKLRQRQQAKNPQMKGITNKAVSSAGGDGSPSAVSLADDHFDQYAIRRSITLAGSSVDASRNPTRLIRRNRPSLMRQNEVAADSGTPSPVFSADGSDNALLGRRKTLATDRGVRQSANKKAPEAAPLPLHSVYGMDDSLHAELLLGAKSGERGSLPNLDDLAANELRLKREEAALLASERRLAEQRRLQEEELLRANPLRYLINDNLRNWLFRWRIPILMVVGNIFLFYYFIHLLTTKRSNDNHHPPSDRDG